MPILLFSPHTALPRNWFEIQVVVSAFLFTDCPKVVGRLEEAWVGEGRARPEKPGC